MTVESPEKLAAFVLSQDDVLLLPGESDLAPDGSPAAVGS